MTWTKCPCDPALDKHGKGRIKKIIADLRLFYVTADDKSVYRLEYDGFNNNNDLRRAVQSAITES